VAELRAKDLMSRNVVTVRADDSLQHAAKVLSQRRISGAPVVDGGGRLIGVVSKTDILRSWQNASLPVAEDFFELPGDNAFAPDWATDGEAAKGRVSDVMHRGLFVVDPDATAAEIAALMLQRRIHRVLVTRGEELLGVVSSLDVLKAVPNRS
jgi:CBS domain-containing protein